MGGRVAGGQKPRARSALAEGCRCPHECRVVGNHKTWCLWSPQLMQVILLSSPGYDAI